MRELSIAEVSMINGGSVIDDCGIEVAAYTVASASFAVASGPIGWALAIVGWGFAAHSAQTCTGGAGSGVYEDEYACHQAS